MRFCGGNTIGEVGICSMSPWTTVDSSLFLRCTQKVRHREARSDLSF